MQEAILNNNCLFVRTIRPPAVLNLRRRNYRAGSHTTATATSAINLHSYGDGKLNNHAHLKLFDALHLIGCGLNDLSNLLGRRFPVGNLGSGRSILDAAIFFDA
jgi:hypothetical protein